MRCAPQAAEHDAHDERRREQQQRRYGQLVRHVPLQPLDQQRQRRHGRNGGPKPPHVLPRVPRVQRCQRGVRLQQALLRPARAQVKAAARAEVGVRRYRGFTAGAAVRVVAGVRFGKRGRCGRVRSAARRPCRLVSGVRPRAALRPAEWVDKAANPSKCLAALFLILERFFSQI